MRYQVSLYIGIASFISYSLLLLLISGYLLAQVVIIISIILFVLGIVNMSSFSSKERSPEPRNKLKFIAVLLPIIMIIFSRGYLAQHFTGFYSYNTADTIFIAVLFPIAELSVVILSNYESAIYFGKRSERVGYDMEDVDQELGRFSRVILMITLLSVVLGYMSFLAVLTLPTFDIGLIPALIIFFAVIIILMRNTISKTS
ncbi:MAG: hypothetical protein ACYCSG_04815 [Thermoplasmataceae archaeon]